MNLKGLLKFYYVTLRYRYLVNQTEIKYLLRAIAPGATAIDIGAHKGGYLFWIRKKAGTTGKVIGFEPQKSLYEKLLQLCKHFNWKNVSVENIGVSDQEGLHKFYIPLTKDGASAEASLTDFRVGTGQFIETSIQTTTLDRYCAKYGLQPSFIKIDVEGFEYEVLNGTMEILRTCKPKILIEVEQRHLKNRVVADVFGLLLGVGYTGHFIYDRKILPLVDFRVEEHQNVSVPNFETSARYANNFIFE